MNMDVDKMTAKQLHIMNRGGGDWGDAIAYELDPPMYYKTYDFIAHNELWAATQYVWVSQSGIIGLWETYIFATSKEDPTQPIDWMELPGSRKGMITPDDLMSELGYKVIPLRGE